MQQLKYQIEKKPFRAESYNPSEKDKSAPLSRVAFSESEGEQLIDENLGSVHELSEREYNVVYDKFEKRCDICQTVKPPRTHHCSQCKRCVVRMDHHCVWIGNCVGLHNMKPFLLFLIYAIITCMYSFGICIFEFFRCTAFDNDDSCKAGDIPDSMALEGLQKFNVVLCSFGLFFTFMMGFLVLAVLVSQSMRI